MAAPEFTDQIRKRTRAAHKLSDVLIVSKLAVVLTDQTQYGRALAYFYPIYCHIERAMAQHSKIPELAPLADIVSNELNRKEALEADLEYYLGSDWQAQISCQSAAVDKYLEHLTDLETQNPLYLAPYAYSMYIPLLIGAMGYKVKKTLGLPDNQGIAFFTFDSSSSVPKAQLMKQLKAAMNQVGTLVQQGEAREKLFAEAVKLYELNISVVMSFPTGWEATVKALGAMASHVPSWVVLTLLGVGASSAYLLLRH